MIRSTFWTVKNIEIYRFSQKQVEHWGMELEDREGYRRQIHAIFLMSWEAIKGKIVESSQIKWKSWWQPTNNLEKAENIFWLN